MEELPLDTRWAPDAPPNAQHPWLYTGGYARVTGRARVHMQASVREEREQRDLREALHRSAVEQRDLDRLNDERDRDYQNQMRIALAMSNSISWECIACGMRQCAQEAEVCAHCNSLLLGFKRGSKHLHSRQFFYAMADGCDCTDCTNENQSSVDHIWQLCEAPSRGN